MEDNLNLDERRGTAERALGGKWVRARIRAAGTRRKGRPSLLWWPTEPRRLRHSVRRAGLCVVGGREGGEGESGIAEQEWPTTMKALCRLEIFFGEDSLLFGSSFSLSQLVIPLRPERERGRSTGGVSWNKLTL